MPARGRNKISFCIESGGFGGESIVVSDAADKVKETRKAVVTPTNLGWTLYELVEELGKEWKAING
ncbi:MAG: DUF3783 domain-containing protein [Lachnospiraceae bacterium]|nr:DUF3783 domain-containing protein [Lachnospiraceae bacterium]